ncbi:MAG: ATP-binding protein [Ignavibacteriales bacterium]|nr:MAG: ATP-binding protein [Ignavibacteriales bacterium]
MLTRILTDRIKARLFQGKTIILYGARQTGKTTLVKSIMQEYVDEARYLNCEILSVEQNLREAEPDKLKSYLGGRRLVVLDEAQHIPDIGKILKLMTDEMPETQILATGSSSLNLRYMTAEPMTGRTIEYLLYPLSILEIRQQGDWFAADAQLERLLRLGSYPEIYLSTDEFAKERLDQLASSYLYRDLLRYEGIKKSSVLNDLLISLALQVGSEVSYHELAVKLGINRLTVQKYIDLLEQSYVIFRLRAFSRNLRKELTKSVKIYFYDTGIRNALLQNYNLLELRQDSGALWKNYCIAERMKANSFAGRKVNSYFWRTYDQKEVDYIEEADGKLTGYEFKYSPDAKIKSAADFKETYNADVHRVDRKNLWKFAELRI